jgi:hypothetical protein
MLAQRRLYWLSIAGAVLVIAGAIRMQFWVTVPSFELIFVGILLLIFPFLPSGRIDVGRLRSAMKPAYVGAASWAFKASWLALAFHFFPNALLDVRLYEKAAEGAALNLSTLSTQWWEPMVPLLLAGLVRIGVPFDCIALVLVPGVSALTAIVYYYLFRIWHGNDAAWVAMFLFAFAPLEMSMLQIGMYRDIVGTMLLLVAMYFTFTEKSRLRPKTIVSALALFLSDIVPSLIYLASLVVYTVLNRRSIGTGIPRLLLLMAGIWLVVLSIAEPHLLSWIAQAVMSWSFADPATFLARLYHLRHTLLPTAVLVVVAIPAILDRRDNATVCRSSLAFAMLVGIGLLTLPLLVNGNSPSVPYLGSGYQAIFVLWHHIEIPIAIYAAMSVSSSSRSRAFLFTVLALVIAGSLALATRYFYA